MDYSYVYFADTLALENGGTYEFDSFDSLMGRVGFAAGFKCPSNFGDVYVRASVVHEFWVTQPFEVVPFSMKSTVRTRGLSTALVLTST